MKVVFLSPSRVSTGGSARFLRGAIAELRERGHEVVALEPVADLARANLDLELDDADLVLVHDSSRPELVTRIGDHRARHDGYRLLLHATDRQAETATPRVGRFDLAGYDGVLAGDGEICGAYLQRGWGDRVWTWREAVDTRDFYPLPATEREADLIWIGSGEAAAQRAALGSLLIRPARQLRLHGSVCSSSLPWATRLSVRLAGLGCRPTPSEDAIPELLARHRLTVHLPPGAGAPSMVRPLEALACGIPLVSTPWDDVDGLLRPEQDYLVARDCAEMREAMQAILEFPEFAEQLRQRGLETIRSGHTCAHRVDELLAIEGELHGSPALQGRR